MTERLREPGATRLLGRRSECARLDEMIGAVRDGESRTLLLRGEAGIGKSALLQYALQAASSLRVVRAVGVESEMELAFASLHQLCAPLLEHLNRLPAPLRDALEVVFGLSSGPAPDRFLVGLAVLTLFSEVAEQQPLMCVIDDAQWLDQASALTLAFLARRLLAEPVGLLFAARKGLGEELQELPALELRGLDSEDARALLGSAVRFMLDERVRDRIVAETRGNPLALIELPRGLSAAELAGGFGLLGTQALPGRIEDSFRRRLDSLSEDARSLMLIAAAEPVGDPLLLSRAAGRLGITVSTSADAETDGLLALGERVMFRHPLVRTAVYRSALPARRRAAHLALAEATDREVDPDRRAWHLAAAAEHPDERIATELERSAGRAQARGGLAAAAAFLRRAVALTSDPARRCDRALAAAQASLDAGAFETALGLLATAESGLLEELQRARVELLRGQAAFASSMGSSAVPLLLSAARRLEALDVDLARETYLDAWGAALFAGQLASPESDLHAVSRAALAAPEPDRPPRTSDLMLKALATQIVDGVDAAAPMLGELAELLFDSGFTEYEDVRRGWFTSVPGELLFRDDAGAYTVCVRQLREAREAGALARLPIDLTTFSLYFTRRGQFRKAADAITEADAVTEATGSRIAPYAIMMLTALRGHQTEAEALIESAVAEAAAGGQGFGVQQARFASAIMYNGLGRYEEALAAAEEATAAAPEMFLSAWSAPELIEAAHRLGRHGVAAAELERLMRRVGAVPESDWGMGLVARSRALLAEDEAAEPLYRDAIERFGRTRLRPDLARAHLLYGEWLRRRGRRVDAREQLRTAYEMFEAIGMDAFSERARIELLATGERVRKRTVETRDELTAQERQIAQLAGEGLSNPAIGARLFLSPRTVEWHLRKVFGKLDISSRTELSVALRASESALIAT